MAGVTTYSCTRCRPVDTEIIEAYQILTNTSKAVSQQEAVRVSAENARVAAENQRTLVFNQDHGTAVADHGIAASDHATASADHTTAVADHGTASSDHTLAVQDHEASVDATSRADSAATAAQHMVDIHQGPPGPAGVSPIVGENGNWFEWDDTTHQYVDTGEKAQGEVGPTPDFSIGTVTTGEAGSQASASITGTAAAPVLNLTIPKGDQGIQGNTGSSVAYPYELVNNRTTDDATKGLSAAEGKRLGDDITQLEHKKADKDTVRAYMMSDRAKNALLAVLDKVAFAVPDVSDEMDELTEALFNLDEVVGVEATYTQGATVIWSDGVSSLDDLLPNLVVKAVYGDGTKVVVHNFILSGSLTAGTSTITVTYLGEFIDTFDVTVTAYGSKTTYTMAEGSILNDKGTASQYTYGTYTNAQGIDGFGTSSTRRVFVTNFGKQKLRNNDDEIIDAYPIRIPADATKVNIAVTGTNQQIAGRVIYLLDNGRYIYAATGYPYKNFAFVAGSQSCDISAVTGRSDTYFLVYGKRTNDASYTENEPTGVTVEFVNENI